MPPSTMPVIPMGMPPGAKRRDVAQRVMATEADQLSKQRVLAALSHRRPDRIPKCDTFWGEFVTRSRQAHGLGDDVDLMDFYQIDLTVVVPDETPFPSRAEVLAVDGDDTTHRDGWGRVIRTREGAYFYEPIAPALRTRAELDSAEFESPLLDSRYACLDPANGFDAGRRCYFVKTGGPYLRSSFMRGGEAFLTDIAGDPDFAAALANRVADHQIQIGLEGMRRADLYETGVWIYDDMAYNDGPMFSPASFERIFLPAYARMVRAWKSAGARFVLLHCDGNIEPILDMVLEAGIDGINPVEPRSGMDLVRLKRRYGDRLALIGGMCNAVVLPQGPIERIVARARAIIDAGRDGGVIIGAHSIGPDIPVEHYDAYHAEVLASTRDDAVR